jgi:hypothetical protein
MDAEIKQKWVEALRGGQFKQGEGVLRTNDDRYCCLGVLCSVSGLEWDMSARMRWQAIFDGTSGIGDVPSAYAAKIGLTQLARDTLITMNDTSKEPFPKIADYIESNL